MALGNESAKFAEVLQGEKLFVLVTDTAQPTGTAGAITPSKFSESKIAAWPIDREDRQFVAAMSSKNRREIKWGNPLIGQ